MPDRLGFESSQLRFLGQVTESEPQFSSSVTWPDDTTLTGRIKQYDKDAP